jgi:hypothetical protein
LAVAETVLEYLIRCRISETQARQHLAAGHVRLNGVPVTGGETELPDADAAVDIFPF